MIQDSQSKNSINNFEESRKKFEDYGSPCKLNMMQDSQSKISIYFFNNMINIIEGECYKIYEDCYSSPTKAHKMQDSQSKNSI